MISAIVSIHTVRPKAKLRNVFSNIKYSVLTFYLLSLVYPGILCNFEARSGSLTI